MTIRAVIIHTIEPLGPRTIRKLAHHINPIPQPKCWLC